MGYYVHSISSAICLCLWLNLFLVICHSSPSSSSSSSLYNNDRITSLPGQPQNVGFDQYSGYITVNQTAGRALFYWLAEAPINRPLVVGELLIRLRKKSGLFGLIPMGKPFTSILILGINVGNAVIDDYHNYIGTFEYWWTHGLISDSTYKVLGKRCDMGSSTYPSSDCIKSLEVADQEMGNIDQYSIYTLPCNSTSSVMSRSRARGHYPWMSRAYDPCSKRYTRIYLNLPDVQKALHANVTGGSYPWQSCRNNIQPLIFGDQWTRSGRIVQNVSSECAEGLNF
ncbi:hypothetical protein OROGR_009213 [Orobanche gracilis]